MTPSTAPIYAYMSPNKDPFYPGQPEKAFVPVLPNCHVGVVTRGHQGYSVVYDYSGDEDTRALVPYAERAQLTRDTVRKMNEAIDITPEQAYAALIGSMRGWNVPGADPAHWTRNEAEQLLYKPECVREVTK